MKAVGFRFEFNLELHDTRPVACLTVLVSGGVPQEGPRQNKNRS